MAGIVYIHTDYLTYIECNGKRFEFTEVTLANLEDLTQEERNALIPLIEQRVQEKFDIRQKINQLPKEDINRSIDPAKPGYFWDGNDIVTRLCIFKVLDWPMNRVIPTFSFSKT